MLHCAHLWWTDKLSEAWIRNFKMSLSFEEQILFKGTSIMQTQKYFLFFHSTFMKCLKKPYYLTSGRNLRQKELFRISKGEILKGWKWKSLSCVQLFATLWTIQSMEFSRPEYGVGSHSPLQGISQSRGQTQVSCNAGGFFTSSVEHQLNISQLI